MKKLQLALLLVFVVCAAMTALQQVRYGMITGRVENGDPQDDPAAKACSRRAAAFAVSAAVSLALCLLAGVVSRING